MRCVFMDLPQLVGQAGCRVATISLHYHVGLTGTALDHGLLNHRPPSPDIDRRAERSTGITIVEARDDERPRVPRLQP